MNIHDRVKYLCSYYKGHMEELARQLEWMDTHGLKDPTIYAETKEAYNNYVGAYGAMYLLESEFEEE